MKHKQVRVGVGVIIVAPDGKILLGKRRGSHGEGEWSLPGGHLEWKESFKECGIREVEEETDIKLGAFEDRFVDIGFTNDIFEKEDLHYITLFIGICLKEFVDPKNMEPDKCDGWGWFDIDKVPLPIFPPLETILKTGTIEALIGEVNEN